MLSSVWQRFSHHGSIAWLLMLAWIGGQRAPAAEASRDAVASGRRPNIVLVVTDDLGWGDLGCHGNPVISTPCINAMLARGGELTRFYVSPVCSPTRASLMTGRYNYRTRVIDTYRGHSMMDPDEQTVAELLRQAGYATGIFGKWHLGDCYPMRPQDQGFDQAVVLRGGGLGQPSDAIDNQGHYTNPTLWRNGQAFVADGYCTDVFFDELLAFVRQCVESERPFFAYVATNAPHGPFHDVPPALYQKYKSLDLSPVVAGKSNQIDTVARIFAMVENIDQNVGRLRATLLETGIADNTLVIFMSDNGPALVRYVGNRRGMKGEVLEGGIASPWIVEWPGHVRPGLRDDRLAAHVDLLPTLLDVAGVAPPADLRLDGRSLLPLLTETATAWPERKVFLQSHRGTHPVAGHNMAAVGQRWKLVRPKGFGRTAPPPGAAYQLYDLAADPKESHELSERHADTAARLRADYDTWFEDVSTTRPDNYAPPRIVLDAEKEPVVTLTRQDWQATGSGWGEQGTWLVHSAAPCQLDVEVLCERAAAGSATLVLGGNEVTQAVEHLTKSIVFRNVTTPTGDWSLGFRLTRGDTETAPYQVLLTHLP